MGRCVRKPWEEYFADMAKLVSSRSTCDRLQVGCVIVDSSNRVLATGYNGSLPGQPHCTDVGCLLEGGSCVRTVHAEANAVAHAARAGVALEGSTAYVTHSPCVSCLKQLISAGVTRIIYAEPYRQSPAWHELAAQVVCRCSNTG